MLVLVSPSANSSATRTDWGERRGRRPGRRPLAWAARLFLKASPRRPIGSAYSHRTGGARPRIGGRNIGLSRYALNRSYVLLGLASIEPITDQIPDRPPLGKAQRIEELTYESPALPLSYSATTAKLTERALPGQPQVSAHDFCHLLLASHRAHRPDPVTVRPRPDARFEPRQPEPCGETLACQRRA
jgi:hypothetical protein